MTFPKCINLTITFNEHALVYESAEQWAADNAERGFAEWASEEEREKAVATNSVWACQWYPDTPVGFCALAASSFEALMAAVNAQCEGER